MAAPARLEFLTALAIKSTLPNVSVIPNYSCDDEGLPTSTAGGNKADIECYENQNGVIVEVTMAEGRQQTMMEIWPIARHLQEFSHANNINCQCVFIAPTIYTDSQNKLTMQRSVRELSFDHIPYMSSSIIWQRQLCFFQYGDLSLGLSRYLEFRCRVFGNGRCLYNS